MKQSGKTVLSKNNDKIIDLSDLNLDEDVETIKLVAPTLSNRGYTVLLDARPEIRTCLAYNNINFVTVLPCSGLYHKSNYINRLHNKYSRSEIKDILDTYDYYLEKIKNEKIVTMYSDEYLTDLYSLCLEAYEN
jgi:hypothetical protein